MRNLKGKIVFIVITVLLISAVYTNVVSAVGNALLINAKPALENVRDYAPALSSTTMTYAIDGGFLYAGQPGRWVQRPTPPNVVVGAVALDPNDAQKVYMGAANELALYWSVDGAQTWRRVPLTDQYIGGITDIAFNSAQRTLYVATDTAGLFRLRDVGSSMIWGGQSYFDEPILEVVTDQSGAGLAFARTQWHLYRGFNNGMQWLALDTLTSAPTALAIAGDNPATVYVGTVDRGLLKSQDGYTWETVNAGFVQTAGTRLQVDALAVDPAQPNVLYVATSYLLGSTALHQTAAGIAMSVDGAANWTALVTGPEAPVVRLLPVSGVTGAVYGLTNLSRTPQPFAKALELTADKLAISNPVVDTAVATTWPTPLVSWLAVILTIVLLIGYLLRELYSGTATLERRPQSGLVERMVHVMQIDRLAHRLGLS